MKKIIKFILLGITAVTINVVYGYPPGFSKYIYKAKDSQTPFPGVGNGNIIEFKSNCNVNNFPTVGAGVKCTSKGKLVIDNNNKSVSDDGSISTFEGMIAGLFAVKEKNYFLVQLGKSSNNEIVNCENQDVLALPITNGNDQVKIFVNSLIFNLTLQFNTQGCELGHPKIISFEIINCSDRKCQASLQTPLLSTENINVSN